MTGSRGPRTGGNPRRGRGCSRHADETDDPPLRVTRIRGVVLSAAACAAVGLAACSRSGSDAAVTGVKSNLLVVGMQPFRFGEIGACNQFQLWTTATDATGDTIAVDSSVWTSGDSSSIAVTRTGGLLTSHHASPAITITVTAWAGTKSGAATGLWVASADAVQLLDPNGNPYPEPPCPERTAAAAALLRRH